MSRSVRANLTDRARSQQPNGTQGNQSQRRANFDRIAYSYRWLEYLTFGSILKQTRTCFLPNLHDRRQALLFGDGDGRFLAQLLAQNPLLAADAIDTSIRMLDLLRRQAKPFARESDGSSRLRTHHQDALTYFPILPSDLVVTHFFLDCLSQPEVDCFIRQITPTLAADALWLVSEFRISRGALALPSSWLVRALYFAFKLLTGLRVNRLPEYQSSLCRAGFVRVACRHRLFGLLISELWQRRVDAAERELGYAHT